MLNNTISTATYRAASDRIRRGAPQPMDEAICDAHDRQAQPGPTMRAWYDLPMAADAWREAARETERD